MDEEKLLQELNKDNATRGMARYAEEELTFYFPLTDEAYKADPETDPEGWALTTEATDEQLKQLLSTGVGQRGMFEHVFRAVIELMAISDGQVFMTLGDGKNYYKHRDELTLEDAEHIKRWWENKAKKDDEALQLIEDMLLVADVDQTSRRLAGEDVSDTEPMREVFQRVGSDTRRAFMKRRFSLRPEREEEE